MKRIIVLALVSVLALAGVAQAKLLGGRLTFSVPRIHRVTVVATPAPTPVIAATIPIRDIFVWNGASVSGSDLYATEYAIQWQALEMRNHWGNPAIQFENIIGSPAAAIAAGDYVVSLQASQPINGGSYHNVLVGPFAYIPVIAGQTSDWQYDMSHETIEMLMDPYLSSWYFGHRLLEICDPVADAEYPQSGVYVADWVFPSWYGFGSPPYDAAGILTYAGELDGYPPTG